MYKVKAKSAGWYFGKRIRPGDVFDVAEKKFLGKWMEVLEEPKPKRKPVAKKAVAKKAEAKKAEAKPEPDKE